MEAVSMAPRQSQDGSPEIDPDKTPRAVELSSNLGMYGLCSFDLVHVSID